MTREQPVVVSVARGSYMSVYTMLPGYVVGWTFMNSMVIDREEFPTNDIVTEDDLRQHATNRQRQFRESAASSHVYRRAM